mgnify:FL=1
MHYIITDIHNDSWRFMKLLEKIDLKEEDHLYLLGDLFDRCMDHPDPAGVYFQVLKLGKKCTVIRGNHDHWLANYIFRYYGMDERDRVLLQSYPYNSFHLLQERLTEVDLKQLAERILSWPVQVEIEVDGQPYLLAHACTAEPGKWKLDNYYLMGDLWYKVFLHEGVHGYISVCGHQNMGNGSIWKNKKENVYLCDCGCGFENGKTRDAFCLETKETFYV